MNHIKRALALRLAGLSVCTSLSWLAVPAVPNPSQAPWHVATNPFPAWGSVAAALAGQAAPVRHWGAYELPVTPPCRGLCPSLLPLSLGLLVSAVARGCETATFRLSLCIHYLVSFASF